MKNETIYLIIINAFGLLIMLMDKRKARKKLFRIPEFILFAVCILGGSLGSVIGMYLFHHKTRKPQFTIGFPIILAIHILLYFLK